MAQTLYSRKLDTAQELSNKQRRSFIRGSLAALATSPLLVASRRVAAQNQNDQGQNEGEFNTPNDPFILLLHGIYQPVPKGQGPADNLGLTTPGLHLSDGTYVVNTIYPVFGIGNQGDAIDQHDPIGNFYGSFTNGLSLCAYHLPEGAIAMRFRTPADIPVAANVLGINSLGAPVPDGSGGAFLPNVWGLDILEATGIYQTFVGGHNCMVDHLHQLADGQFDEFCFCNISTYPLPV